VTGTPVRLYFGTRFNGTSTCNPSSSSHRARGYTCRELRKLDTHHPAASHYPDDGQLLLQAGSFDALAQKKARSKSPSTARPDMERQLAATLSPHASVSAIDTAAHSVTIVTNRAYSKTGAGSRADPIRVPLAGMPAADVLSVTT